MPEDIGRKSLAQILTDVVTVFGNYTNEEREANLEALKQGLIGGTKVNIYFVDNVEGVKQEVTPTTEAPATTEELVESPVTTPEAPAQEEPAIEPENPVVVLPTVVPEIPVTTEDDLISAAEENTVLTNTTESNTTTEESTQIPEGRKRTSARNTKPNVAAKPQFNIFDTYRIQGITWGIAQTSNGYAVTVEGNVDLYASTERTLEGIKAFILSLVDKQLTTNSNLSEDERSKFKTYQEKLSSTTENTQTSTLEDNVPLRITNTKPYTQEDLNKAKNFIESVFGGNVEVSIEDASRAKMLADTQQMGYFAGNTIHLFSNAEIGTVYHEAMHAVVGLYLTPADIKSVLGELRRRADYNSAVNQVKALYARNGVNLTTFQAEEEILAEEFREWVMSEGTLQIPEVKQSVFQRLWNFIQMLFGFKEWDANQLQNKQNNIATLYNNIVSNKYAKPYQLTRVKQKESMNRIVTTPATFTASYKNAEGVEEEVEMPIEYLTNHVDAMRLVYFQSLVNEPSFKDVTSKSFDKINIAELNRLVNAKYDNDEENLDALWMKTLMGSETNFEDIKAHFTRELARQFNHVLNDTNDKLSDSPSENEDEVEDRNQASEILSAAKINTHDLIPPIIRSLIYSLEDVELEDNGMPISGQQIPTIEKRMKDKDGNWVRVPMMLNVYQKKRTSLGLPVAADYVRIERFLSDKFKNKTEPSISQAIEHLISLSNKQGKVKNRGLYPLSQLAAQLHTYYTAAWAPSMSTSTIGSDINEAVDREYKAMNAFNILAKFVVQFTNLSPEHTLNVLDAETGEIRRVKADSEKAISKLVAMSMRQLNEKYNEVSNAPYLTEEHVNRLNQLLIPVQSASEIKKGLLPTTKQYEEVINKLPEFFSLLGIEFSSFENEVLPTALFNHLKAILLSNEQLSNSFSNGYEEILSALGSKVDVLKKLAEVIAQQYLDSDKTRLSNLYSDRELVKNLSIKTFLNNVLELDAENSSEVTSSQYLLNGQSRYGIQRYTAQGITINKFNQYNNKAQAMYPTNDSMTDEELETVYAKRKDYVAQYVPEMLTIGSLNSIWVNESIKHGHKIVIGIDAGLTTGEQDAKETADLSASEKLQAQIANAFVGTTSYSRAADRSVENTFTLTDAYGKPVMFVTPQESEQNDKKITESWKNYLIDELVLVLRYKEGTLPYQKNAYVNSKLVGPASVINGAKRGDFLRFWDSIASDKLLYELANTLFNNVEQVNSEALGNNTMEGKRVFLAGKDIKIPGTDEKSVRQAIEDNPTILALIKEDLTRFINEQTESTLARAKELGLTRIAPLRTLKDKVRTKYGDEYVTTEIEEFVEEKTYLGIPESALTTFLNEKTSTKEVNEKRLKEVMKFYTLNQMMSFVEQSKTFLGDPATFKNLADWDKRMSGSNSTKDRSLVVLRDKSDNNEINLFETNTAQKLIFLRTDENGRVIARQAFVPANNSEEANTRYKQVNDMIKEVAYTSDVKVKQELMDKVFRFAFAMNADEVVNPSEFRFLTGFGWRVDGKVNDNTIKTALFNDVETISKYYLDDVEVESMDIKTDKNGKLSIVYKDKDGKKIPEDKISYNRRHITRAVYEDGITNPSDLLKKVNGYMNPYKGLNEADAQGMVTLDEWKAILQRGKSWTRGHQKVYEKAVLGLPLAEADLFYIQPLKTQHYGPVDDYLLHEVADNSVQEDRAYVTGFYKHSLTPLIPSVVAGTPLEALMYKLMKQQVGIAQYKSAMKVGFEALNNLYDTSGNFNSAYSTGELKTQNIDYAYIGIQVNIAAKVKDEVTSGTQQNKNLDHNIFAFGETRKDEFSDLQVPVSNVEHSEIKYMTNDEAKALQARRRADLVRLTTEKGFYDLASEIDLTIINDTTVRIGNMEKLISILEEGNSSTNQNVIDSIAYLRTKLEHRDNRTPFFDEIMDSVKLQNIVHSILNSRMINLKRNGGAKPQVSVTGRETEARVMWVNDEGQIVQKGDKNGKKGKVVDNVAGMTMVASDYLKFYEVNKAGTKTTLAECLLALPKEWFGWVESMGGLDAFNEAIQDLHNEEDKYNDSGSDLTFEQHLRTEIRKAKNEAEKDKLYEKLNMHKLCRVLGYRIPHQAYSSTDILRVKKFLPTSFGDGAVVPAEIVAKAGSDFDIDKMTLYTYNVSKENGVIKVDGLRPDLTEDGVIERYIDFIYTATDKKALNDSIKQMVDAEVNAASKDKSEVPAAINLYNWKSKDKNFAEEERMLNIEKSKLLTAASTQIFISIESTATSAENLIPVREFVTAAKLIGNDKKGFDKTIIEWRTNAALVINNNPTLDDNIKKLFNDLIKSYDDILNAKFSKNVASKLDAIIKQETDIKASRAEIKKKIDESNRQLRLQLQEEQALAVGEQLAEKFKNDKFKFDKFKSLPYEEQLGIDGLQNALLDAELDIISNIANFRQLTSPIDDAVFKDSEAGALTQSRFVKSNSQELKDLYKLREQKLQEFVKNYRKANNGLEPTDLETGVYLGIALRNAYAEAVNKWLKATSTAEKNKPAFNSSILNIPGQLDKFIFFLSGKGGVGQTAVHVTSHALTQKAGVHTSVSFEILPSGELKSAGGWNVPVNLVRYVGTKQEALNGPLSKYVKNDRNQTYELIEYSVDSKNNLVANSVIDSIPFGTKLYTSFAGYKSIEGSFVITEVLSSFLTAYVDIAKDPYIFELNAGNSVANTVMMMVRAGVPTDYIVKMITSKSVVDYVKGQQANESMSHKAAGIESENYTVKLNTALKFSNSNNNINQLFKIFDRIDLNSGEFMTVINSGNRSLIESVMNSINRIGLQTRVKDEKQFKYLANLYESKIMNLNEVKLHEEYLKVMNSKSLVNAVLADKLLPNSTRFITHSENIKGILDDLEASAKGKENAISVLQTDYLESAYRNKDTNELLSELSSYNFEKFNNPEMQDTIEYNDFQLKVLDEFLLLQEKSKSFQKMIRATSADTRGNLAEVKSNGNDLEMLEQVLMEGAFEHIEKILYDSPVSGFFSNKKRGYAVGKELLLAESDTKVRTMMKVMMKELNVGTTSEDMDRASRRIQEHFKMFMIHADLGNGTHLDSREIFNKYLDSLSDDLEYVIDGKGHTVADLIQLIQKISKKANNEGKEDLITMVAEGLGIDTQDADKMAIFATIFDNKFVQNITTNIATTPRSFDEINSDLKQASKETYLDTVGFVAKRIEDGERNLLIADALKFKQAIDASQGFSATVNGKPVNNLFNAFMDVVLATQGTVRSRESLYEFLPTNYFTDKISPQVSAFMNMSDEQKSNFLEAFADQFIRNQWDMGTKPSTVKKLNGMVPGNVEYLRLAYSKEVLDELGKKVYTRKSDNLETGELTSLPSSTQLFISEYKDVYNRQEDKMVKTHVKVPKPFVGVKGYLFGYTYKDDSFNNQSYVQIANQLANLKVSDIANNANLDGFTIKKQEC